MENTQKEKINEFDKFTTLLIIKNPINEYFKLKFINKRIKKSGK